jgi:penicillin-binding protein 1A
MRILTAMLFTMAAGGLAVAAAAFTLARDLPTDDDLKIILTSPQVEVDSRYLNAGAEREYAQHAVCRCGLALGSAEIPQTLIKALLVDEETGSHWFSLSRAPLSYLWYGTVKGGSPFAERLTRKLITGNKQSGIYGVVGEMRQAIVARQVERALTREEILTAYFNQMDFGGPGVIGVVQAARRYFGKAVKDLDLFESAMLVGMLRATAVDPVAHPDAADREAQAVLKKMLDKKVIGETEYFRALSEMAPVAGQRQIAVSTGYYVAWARAEFASIAMSRPGGTGNGLVRYVVGLDPRHQAQGEAAIRDELAGNADRRVGQGALVAMDGDGRVDALVGGADFAVSQFDRATKARRQPGSAFKLFVYTAAINAGLSPSSIRTDGPVSIHGYAPDNNDHAFLGPIPLMTAFAKSRNTVAVQLGDEVGTDAIANVARELGVTSPLRRDASLALGTSEVTLLELTSAFVPFMGEGRPVQPYAVRMALNGRGEVIYRRHPEPPKPAVNAVTLQAMRDMLRAVVMDGTGQQARLADRWSAGKTGTTQRNRDAWFIGFTDRLTTGIWFGNDDNSPMTDIAGGGMPALAWRRFNEAINETSP